MARDFGTPEYSCQLSGHRVVTRRDCDPTILGLIETLGRVKSCLCRIHPFDARYTAVVPEKLREQINAGIKETDAETRTFATAAAPVEGTEDCYCSKHAGCEVN